jgi:hypothetical protein
MIRLTFSISHHLLPNCDPYYGEKYREQRGGNENESIIEKQIDKLKHD